MRKLSPFMLLLIFVLSSCSKDKIKPGYIEPDFQEYVDRFVEEGARLGVEVDVRELTVEFGNPANNFCGQAPNFYSDDPPYVIIDNSCWARYEDLERELLMFHELGHAILKRPHLNRRMPNGVYASIMTNHQSLTHLYNEFFLAKKPYYMEELFLENVPSPDWGRIKENEAVYREIPIDAEGSDWFFRNSSGGESSHNGSVIEDGAPGNYVLQISNEDPEVEYFALYGYTISDPQIPIGDEIAFSVNLKLEEVKGNIFLVLRGDNLEKQKSAFFLTNQYEGPDINGTTSNYKEYNFPTLDFFPEGIDLLNVFIIMSPGTTGTVYIDDPKIIRRY